MDEKKFKVIQNSGIWNLVLGISVLLLGITSGVLMIVNGARLLKTKSDMLF